MAVENTLCHCRQYTMPIENTLCQEKVPYDNRKYTTLVDNTLGQ